jgi:hypothetical protein
MVYDKDVLQINQLFNERVDKRVYEKVCEVIEKISDIHNIPVKLLRRDALGENGHCMGLKRDGTLCTKNAAGGSNFCNFHINDRRLCEPVERSGNVVRHNHPWPGPRVEGCPKCEEDKNKRQTNELRELASIM